MKSEHRHELAENELGKLLSRVLDRYLNAILWGIIVVCFAAAAVIFWMRTSSSERSQAWTQLASAQSAEEYEAVADEFPGTEAAAWARLRAADDYLSQGVMLSASDRPASDDRLAQAKQIYDQLLTEDVPPEVREQALNGMAVTLETLSGGDTSAAIAAYEQLLKEFPNSRFRKWAEERVEALKTGRVQEFYAWFREQDPRPADTPLPQDTGPSGENPLGLTDPTSSLQDLLGAPPERVAESAGDDPNPFALPVTGNDTEPAATGDDAPAAEQTPPAGENPFAPTPGTPDTSDTPETPEAPSEPQPDSDAPDTRSPDAAETGDSAGDAPPSDDAPSNDAPPEQPQ